MSAEFFVNPPDQAKSVCPPLVTVVIPCRNERAHIAACLRGLFAQKPVDGGFEVIVTDGMSDDGTREVLEELARTEGRLRLLDNPGRIASKGLNLAIRQARGDIIIRMDAHTDYAPDYIGKCVAALSATGADNVGGAARTRSTSYLQEAISAAYHCALVVGGARFHEVEHEGFVDTVVYGCWRRTAFEKFGYFDEELVRNQDDEFNLRTLRKGGKIWQSASIKSWYSPRNSLRALFEQYAQYGYWKVRVIQKHRLPASWRHLVPGAFVLATLGLGCLAPFSTLALWSWLAVVCAYLSLSLTASFSSARQCGWHLLPVLPAVVGCYHFGYGYGFLRGLFDFVVRGKGSGATFTNLTRS